MAERITEVARGLRLRTAHGPPRGRRFPPEPPVTRAGGLSLRLVTGRLVWSLPERSRGLPDTES